MSHLKNLMLVVLCINCLNLFSDGRLFSHIESFFSPDYVYLDNDSIPDMADPPEDHEDSFVLPIIHYDDDRKLYSSIVQNFDDSLDEDGEGFHDIFKDSVYSVGTELPHVDICVGIILANLHYGFVPVRSDSILPSDAAGGGNFHTQIMHAYNGNGYKPFAVFSCL